MELSGGLRSSAPRMWVGKTGRGRGEVQVEGSGMK